VAKINNSKGAITKTAPEQSLASAYFRNAETERLYRIYMQEFSELTSDAIKFYFDAARKGINFFKAFLFEEIRRRDLRIGGLCQTRKLSVLGSEWEVKGENQQLVDFILDNYRRINLPQVMSDIIEAQIQGMSVFQLFYEIIGNKYYLSDISLIPNYLICVPPAVPQLSFIDFSKMDIYNLRTQAMSERPVLPLIELAPEYYYECYSFDGNEENGLLNGLLDSIIWGYLFKGYSIKDWSVFLERFAMPAVVGKYDPLMSKSDRELLKQAIENFGNLYRAMIPNTAEITTVGDLQKQSSGSLYETFTRYWNDEISIRILGQAMTTDTGQGGSFAKAQVGNLVREDIQSGDRMLITSTLNAISKKIIDINFTNVSAEDYPIFAFKKDEGLEQKLQKADLLVKLKQSGFDADAEEMSDAFGFTLTALAASPIPTSGFSEKPKKKMIEEFLLDLWMSVQ
jgi:phage gp29-like protein